MKQPKLTDLEVKFVLWLRKQSMFADALQRVQVRQEFQEGEIAELKRDFREMLRILMSATDPELKPYQRALKDTRFDQPSPGGDVRPD